MDYEHYNKEIDPSPDEPALHGKALGIIVCVAAFIVAYAAINLLPYAIADLIRGMSYLTWILLSYALFLLIALLFALLLRQPLRKVFPIRKFEKPMVIGSLLTCLSLQCFSYAINWLQAVFFPAEVAGFSEGMSQITGQFPLYLSVFVIGVLPGIFEEVLCRGTMLYALRPLKRVWLRVLIVGVLFGLLHGNPMQIAYAAVLGAGFSFIVIKTDNMLYPVIWHFLTNSFAVLLSFFLTRIGNMAQSMQEMTNQASDTSEMVAQIMSSYGYMGVYIGLALAIAGCGGLLLRAGVRRLNRVALQDIDRAKRRRTLIVCLLLIGLGAAIVFGSCTAMFIEQMTTALK